MTKFLVFDIETGGLSPLHTGVSCIGVMTSSGPVCFSGDFEKKLLDDFVAFVEKENPDKLVSYNGWSFDVPFLRVRALKLGVVLPPVFWDDKRLVDPYNILCRSKGGKQSDFAQLLGLDSVGTGLECVEYFEKGEFGKIEEHCKSDVIVLDTLFSKMLSAGYK